MSRELLLPELAESVVEGEIVKWLVAEGDEVAEEQPVVEVMTDKVTVELPSPFAGVLEQRLAAEGDVVAVGAPIARFADGSTGTQHAGATEEEAPKLEAAGERVEAGTLEPDPPDDSDAQSLFKADRSEAGEPVFQLRRSEASEQATARIKGPYGRPVAVPAARRLARELGLELIGISGSGPNGRIRVEDVRRAAQGTSTPPAPRYRTPAGYEAQEERLPVRGLRRTILNQMVAAQRQTVPTLLVDEVDVTELVALRAKLKPRAEKKGVKLSYLPFIMKAALSALKAFPVVNSSYDESANEIVLKRYYNLGLAVATEVGLVVPVVREVDHKGILELASEVNTLAAKARDGKLEPGDVRGGSFSITNIGSMSGLFSFPVINVPETAILGVHSIKKRPVVLPDDSIAARQMLYLSLSFDHRVIDGAEAAQFLSHIIGLLAAPEALMLES